MLADAGHAGVDGGEAEDNGEDEVEAPGEVFAFAQKFELVVAERGEGGEAAAEAGDEQCLDFRVHLVAAPQAEEYADKETAYDVDDESAGGKRSAEHAFGGHACEISSAGAEKSANACYYH